jgi:dynactin 1
LDKSGLSDTDESDNDESRTPPPTVRSLATERKVLYRRVLAFSSAPRVVDLSMRAEGRKWTPRKRLPAAQILERKMEAEKLSRRVQGLVERTNSIVSIKI